jgi:hypothetical protein
MLASLLKAAAVACQGRELDRRGHVATGVSLPTPAEATQEAALDAYLRAVHF